MSESQTDFGPRLKGKMVTKRIVMGNDAWYFGHKRPDDGHTHRWCFYFRSFDDEDMSPYIKKVQIKLHESYAVPIRVFERAPYMVMAISAEFRNKILTRF